jgi:hypothetical protein
MTRASKARRFFRASCVAWLLLVLWGQIFSFPHVGRASQTATWELSLSVLSLVWIGTALWSGVVQAGYRGVGSHTVSRSEAPAEFWWHLAIAALFGVALAGIGVAGLLRGA